MNTTYSPERTPQIPRRGRPRRQDVKPEQVAALLAEGRSLRQVAHLLHCGYGTVHRIIHTDPKLGVLIQNPVAEAL